MNRARILAAASDPEVLAALVAALRREFAAERAYIEGGYVPCDTPLADTVAALYEASMRAHGPVRTMGDLRAAFDDIDAARDRITTLLAEKEAKDRG